MTKKTRTSLKYDVSVNLPDNTTQEITPEKARSVFTNVIDSMRMDEDIPPHPALATSNLIGVYQSVASLPSESAPNLYAIATENAREKIFKTDKDGNWQLYQDLNQDSHYRGLYKELASLPAGNNADYALVNNNGITLYVYVSDQWVSVSANNVAIKKLSDEARNLANTKADTINGSYDPDTETLTIKLLSGNSVISTDTISLDSIPADKGDIYYGFSATTSIDEAAIKSGTSESVPHLKGHKIRITRVTTDPEHMWVWIDDAVGAIKGFEFSGFLSVWASSAISVDGVNGKLYISPNPTSSQDVTFEVMQ